jgi:hypothetical protein
MQGGFAIVEVSKALRIPESLYSSLNSDEHGANKDRSRSQNQPVGLGHCLVPIHLCFPTPVVDLGNERLPSHLPQFLFPVKVAMSSERNR